MMKKGISPLIAAVLLIAFVMTTAGLISNWFIDFSEDETKKAVERGEKEIQCSYSSLDIREAKYNTSDSKIILQVENTGSETLTDFRIQAFYQNDTTMNYITDKGNISLTEGQIQIFTNSSLDDNIETISFYSEDCPTQSRTSEDCEFIEGC